jgi:hypothetical protein
MAGFTRSDERAWRALADAAADPSTGPSVLLQRVKETAGKAIPCASRRDQSVFVALQAVARASGEGKRDRRAQLTSCLMILVDECSEAAGWTLKHAQSETFLEPRSWSEPDLFGSRAGA